MELLWGSAGVDLNTHSHSHTYIKYKALGFKGQIRQYMGGVFFTSLAAQIVDVLQWFMTALISAALSEKCGGTAANWEGSTLFVPFHLQVTWNGTRSSYLSNTFTLRRFPLCLCESALLISDHRDKLSRANQGLNCRCWTNHPDESLSFYCMFSSSTKFRLRRHSAYLPVLQGGAAQGNRLHQSRLQAFRF